MADVKINMPVKDADVAELLALVKVEMLKLLRGYVRRYRVYLREQNNVIEESEIGE